MAGYDLPLLKLSKYKPKFYMYLYKCKTPDKIKFKIMLDLIIYIIYNIKRSQNDNMGGLGVCKTVYVCVIVCVRVGFLCVCLWYSPIQGFPLTVWKICWQR